MSEAKIAEVAYYLPETVLTNDELAMQFGRWEAATIENKIGIRNRHIAGKDETALDMARAASEKVFREYDKHKIDFLVLCTQSPDYYLPTSACILQDMLALPSSVGAFDYNLGCSGYVYGLGIAGGLIAAGIARSVLLVMSETYSKHIHPGDLGNRTIFGDGAAATIVDASEEKSLGSFVFGTNGKGMRNLIVPNGGLRARYNKDDALITDQSGNMRTGNDLYMNGPEIFNFTIETVPLAVAAALEKNKIRLEDLDYVIFHQANSYMINHLRKKLKIPAEKFYDDILETGNTVSATIPIALKNALDNGTLEKGDTVLLCGFGVGFSWGATVITIR